jgi:hypothetical protein
MAVLDDDDNTADSEEFPALLPIGRHQLPLR